MVKRMKQFALIALLLLVISPAFAQEFEQKLQAAAAECGIKVSGIKALEIGKRVKDLYSEKYQLFIEQPIDHTNPAVAVIITDRIDNTFAILIHTMNEILLSFLRNSFICS